MLTILFSVLLAAAPMTVETAVLADTVDYIFYVNDKRVDPETAKIIKLSDIKTITTVKGEAAIELYGPEARNGVIDIKTKNGVTIKNKKKVTHEYVDLGLSVKWATCNVGAEKPAEYGDYYSWGEVKPKPGNTWTNYKFYKSGDSNKDVKFTKYSNSIKYGVVDKKNKLDPEDDVAHVKWGGDWRLPTKKEMEELYTSCSWEWVVIDDVPGFKVTSMISGYKDRFIFLPAAGYRNISNTIDVGSAGHYWTSSLTSVTNNYAYYLCYYYYNQKRTVDIDYRYYGLSVRPVCP